MASPAKTSSRASRGLLRGCILLLLIVLPKPSFAQNVCSNPVLFSGPIDTLSFTPIVAVRADTIIGFSNPAACISITKPGHYRILARIARSLSQKNESYFLTVCNEHGTNCRKACNPNAGEYKVVLDDTVSAVDTVTSEAGTFLFDSGNNIIMLNHFALIADQFPYLLNGGVPEASSVHLLGLIIEETTNTYDLALSQSVSQDSVRPDSTYSYSLDLQNEGSATVYNIELTNMLPEFVTLESFDQTVPSSITGKTLFWSFDSLQTSQAINIGFRVKFTSRPTASIDLVNTSQITGICDTTASNNFAATTVIGLPPIQYDLELSKSVDKDSAQVLEDFSYLLKIINRGPDPATDVMLRDVMPADVIAHDFSVPPVASNQDTLFWQFEALAVGDSIEVTIFAEITESIPMLPTFLTNRAFVSAPLEINPNNSSSEASVKAIPIRYDLELFKTASRDSVQVGRGFSYNLVVVNQGPDPAKDIILKDIIPDFLEITDFNIQPAFTNRDTILWRFDSLAVLDSIQVRLDAKIMNNIPTLPTPVTNMAEVTAPEDFNTSNSTATTLVTVIPMRYDLEAQVLASTDTLRPGESFSYSIDIFNRGPDAAEDVLIRDPKPEHITFVDFSQTPTDISADTVFWGVDSIRAGETFNITISAQIDEFTLTDPLDITNDISVSAIDDSNPVNNTATAVVTVLPPDDCLYLDQNVFTPANGNPLQINFQLSTSRNARLDLYDVTGYHIGTLADQNFGAGSNTFLWDGVNSNGKKVGSGVYILTLRSEGLVCWVKAIVVQ